MIRLDYAGDFDPKQCWDLLVKDENSVLVDCRSSAEWQFVGIPDLDSLKKRTFLIEWQSYPSMVNNDKFLSEVKDSGITEDQKIILLCRSGGRSKSAAEFLTSHGFDKCYNCIYGFEGPHNENGHRSLVGGWKFSRLPWKQA